MLKDFLLSGKLIPSNHALAALGQILLQKPHFADEIIPMFLALRNIKFDTEDCRDISRGKLLEFLKENYRLLLETKKQKNLSRNAQQVRAKM
jgi:hypothetical protein